MLEQRQWIANCPSQPAATAHHPSPQLLSHSMHNNMQALCHIRFKHATCWQMQDQMTQQLQTISPFNRLSKDVTRA